MRIKDKNISGFIIFAALLISFTISHSVIAQNRLPQNIRRVTVTFQYEIDNGKRTDTVWPIYQEIFDSLGRCHTEIDWNLTDHYPHNYCWHTFNGKLKSMTEFFINEKLSTIEEYSYSKDSLIEKRVVKKISPTDTSVFFTQIYKYDLKRNPIEISAKSPDGKMSFISKSTYDLKGKELTRKVKVKKNFYPKDSILKLTSIPVYDSIGRLISEQLTITKANKKTFIKAFKYSYDKSNNQVALIELDVNGKQVHREEKEYMYSRNRLSQVRYYNANDILVKVITKRYELYRTEKNRVREIEY